MKITIYYLKNENYSDKFLEIISILAKQGVQTVPPGVCAPCELQYLSWREIYQRYSSPLLLFFHDERLTAITIASSSRRTLDQALAYSGKTVKVFLRDETVISIDEETKRQIELLFKDKDIKPQTDIFQLLPLIIMAASLDAINPCEFYVLIVFLSLVAFRLGRKAVLTAGVSYSITVFIMYFMMGVGIWKLISYIEEAKIFVAILGFSLGLRAILNFLFGAFGLSLGLRDAVGSFLNRKFKRLPDFFSKRLADCLRKVSENPLSAFAIGVVASAFLLPCTSGPYLIAISLIANLETQLQGVLLLILYNGIIVVPFLMITICIYLLKLKTSKLKKWFSTKQRWLNLIGGSLMIALSLYLIISMR